jgi:predicted nucleic acid-binding protein
MAKYLLDTNIPVYLEIPDSPFHNPVKESFYQLQDEDQLFVSVLSLYELYYGVALNKKEGDDQSAAQLTMVIEEIKKRFTILPLSGKEASIFGEIKARYKERSKEKEEKKETIKKHDVDFILAGLAIEYDLIVVSNDNIFQKIKELFPNLKIENWTKT